MGVRWARDTHQDAQEMAPDGTRWDPRDAQSGMVDAAKAQVTNADWAVVETPTNANVQVVLLVLSVTDNSPCTRTSHPHTTLNLASLLRLFVEHALESCRTQISSSLTLSFNVVKLFLLGSNAGSVPLHPSAAARPHRPPRNPSTDMELPQAPLDI